MIMVFVIKKTYNHFKDVDVENLLTDLIDGNNSNKIEIPGTNLEFYLPKEKKTKIQLPKSIKKIAKKIPIKTVTRILSSSLIIFKKKIQKNNFKDQNINENDLDKLEKMISDILKETKDD